MFLSITPVCMRLPSQPCSCKPHLLCKFSEQRRRTLHVYIFIPLTDGTHLRQLRRMSFCPLRCSDFDLECSYSKWTPGNPCKHGPLSLLPAFLIRCNLACATTSCSSGKVAGLVFFETFSFLWTSQVIANVSLSTLAGGPYGSWYYFGLANLVKW